MSPLDLSGSPALAASRRFSLAALAQLQARLAAACPVAGDRSTLLAAGSLGRLEAHAQSDCDAIIIVPAAAPPAWPVASFFDEVAACGLRPSKPGGIYRTPLDALALTRPQDRGSLEEAPAIFGRRMALLLDARAITGEVAFLALRESVLAWYAGDYLAHYPQAQWTLLINDVARYLHAYAGWQQYDFGRTPDDGWYLRQAKLRSSRLLTFAGLLLLLGASSQRGGEKRDWLTQHLPLTPLERVAAVMQPLDPAGFERLLGAYEAVHAQLCEPEIRAQLLALSPPAGGVLPRYFPEPYASIHASSGCLLRELTRFVLARGDDWHPDFFSYWLF
ncbi:MAG: hypothetical protein EXR83_02240 [Gammaproteobacteria bacterium]|nr:hypothetical protein [Gammaproteobacteria bacterium]